MTNEKAMIDFKAIKEKILKDDEARALYEIYTQRAQLKPERSHALPMKMYQNPADFVEFESELKRKAKQRKKAKEPK